MLRSSMRLLVWFFGCVVSVLFVGLKSHAIVELPQTTVLKQAQQAFGEGNFSKVLELVESLAEKSELSRAIARLKMLSLYLVTLLQVLKKADQNMAFLNFLKIVFVS